MNSEFSKILKKKRYEMGISQETLAKKLFVTKAAVSNWENGTRLPDAGRRGRRPLQFKRMLYRFICRGRRPRCPVIIVRGIAE